MVKIAVRADGGPDIGIGHIERCLILSQQLQKDGAEVFFITKWNEAVFEKIQKEGFEVLELSPDLNLITNLQIVLHWLKVKQAQIVVTDSYLIDKDYLDKLAEVVKLVIIDDLAAFSFPSDVLINQNIYAEKLQYHSSTGKTKFLLGPKFALLRPEYANLNKRRIELKVKKILVTLGGADFFNLTPLVLKVLDTIDRDFTITVIIGTSFNNRQQIIEVVQTMNKPIELMDFSDEFHEVLLRHDLAITGGGTTAYALAATGTPAACFRFVGNQEQNVRALAAYGSLFDLGWDGTLNSDEFERAIINLVDNFRLRKKMAQLGQMLVDGRGTERISSIIFDEYNRKE